jgi:hypothetical protein
MKIILKDSFFLLTAYSEYEGFPHDTEIFLVTCHKKLIGFYNFISEITVFLKMKQDFTNDKKYEMAPRYGIFNLYYESSK